MLFAQAGAATAGKDGRDKAGDFLIESPTCERGGENAPLRRTGLLLLALDEGVDKRRNQGPEGGESQPCDPAFHRGCMQTQVVNFEPESLPIEITFLR